jgi:hypothetical protein
MLLATPVFQLGRPTVRGRGQTRSARRRTRTARFRDGGDAAQYYRKIHPGPIEELVFYDHPSGYDRVHRAMVWAKENIDRPGRARLGRIGGALITRDQPHRPRVDHARFTALSAI